MKLILLLSLLSFSAFSQAVINPASIAVNAASATAISSWMSTQKGLPSKKLAGDLGVNDTKVTLDDVAGITTASVLSIEGEHMDVKVISGKDLTVTRGFNGTAKAAHVGALEVTIMKYRTFNDLARNMIIDGLRQVVENIELDVAQKNAVGVARSKSVAGVQ